MILDKPITKFCSTADEIIEAVANAVENDVIGVNPGVYEFIGGHKVIFKSKRNVTLRSFSGNADEVVFKGGGFHKKNGYRQTPTDEPISILSDNDGVTVRGITIRDSNCHGVKVAGEGNNANITIDGCKFINICERKIKGSAGGGTMVKNMTITNNYFEDNQIPVESDHMADFAGDYIAGIDMMVLDGAYIADNRFVNIRGKHAGARGAIFIWVGSKNVVAEKNIIFNCDRGVCFGNPGSTSVTDGNSPRYVDGGIIRNNIITGHASPAIEIAHTNNVTVCNNIVLTHADNRGISEVTLSKEKLSTGLKIHNNIVRGEINAEGAEICNNITGEATANLW